MNSKLGKAALAGDVSAFLHLVHEKGETIEQTTSRLKDTVLHIASKFNHIELVTEIIKLQPQLVFAEDANKETPLHQACRGGHLEVIKLLLDADCLVAYNLNSDNESVLLVASKSGKLEVVKYMLMYHGGLITVEDEHCTRTSLHVAASEGHLEIVKELLRVGPKFTQKGDSQGCTPLHMACGNGHLEIVRELLRADPQCCFVKDIEGKTPLHWATIKRNIHVLEEIMSTSGLDLAAVLNLTDNNNGNTVLHLAAAAKLPDLVKKLVDAKGIEVNALNQMQKTPLDLVDLDKNNRDATRTVWTLRGAGGKKNSQLHLLESYNTGLHSPRRSFSRTHSSRSQRRASKVKAKQLQIQMEGLQNVRNTITVVAVLIAAVAFAAGTNPPGGVYQEGIMIGKAVLGRTTPYKVFMVCNNVALFSSLGIVIFLVSVIPFQRRPMRKMLGMVHKIMWVSISFMAAAYIAATWAVSHHGKGIPWGMVSLVSIGGGSLLSLFVCLGVFFVKHLMKKSESKMKRAARDGKHASRRRARNRIRTMDHDVELASNNGRADEMVDFIHDVSCRSEVSTNSDIDSGSDYGVHPI